MSGHLDGGRAAREAHESIDRAMASAHYTHAEAREADCWFDADRVASEPATTAWKRLARWRQAQWRDTQGFPVGSDPYRGGLRSKRVGSRIDLEWAREHGSNFLTPPALAAARSRLTLREASQVLDEDALWADLLSSSALCFNLFGTLAGNSGVASKAVEAWWPKLAAGGVSVRFAHSPGRSDHAFLGTQTAFDVAFETDAPGGATVIGVQVKYHEHAAVEAAPDAEARARYLAVGERSGVFVRGWQSGVVGTELQRIWQEHSLILSMLQHGSQHWRQGRLVLVYPALNPSFATAVVHYRALLADPSTFEAVTIESLLQTKGALDHTTRDAIQARYI
jgi:hypothetical protein